MRHGSVHALGAMRCRAKGGGWWTALWLTLPAILLGLLGGCSTAVIENHNGLTGFRVLARGQDGIEVENTAPLNHAHALSLETDLRQRCARLLRRAPAQVVLSDLRAHDHEADVPVVLTLPTAAMGTATLAGGPMSGPPAAAIATQQVTRPLRLTLRTVTATCLPPG